MAAPITTTSVRAVNEGRPDVEEDSSFLSTISSLFKYFTPTKKATVEESALRPVGIGMESYEELYGRIAAVRYEVISLRAQLEAFERMSAWTQQIDLKTLRRPDLEKVGRRLQAKEEELAELMYDQAAMERANLQHVNVQALCFEEDYLRYLITEIIDKGDPESPLTSELICTLGSLKKHLIVERDKLDSLCVIRKGDGPNTSADVN